MQICVVPHTMHSIPVFSFDEAFSSWVLANANVCVDCIVAPCNKRWTREKSRKGSKLASDRPIAVQTTRMLTYSKDMFLCCSDSSYLHRRTYSTVSDKFRIIWKPLVLKPAIKPKKLASPKTCISFAMNLRRKSTQYFSFLSLDEALLLAGLPQSSRCILSISFSKR